MSEEARSPIAVFHTKPSVKEPPWTRSSWYPPVELQVSGGVLPMKRSVMMRDGEAADRLVSKFKYYSRENKT